VTIGSKGTTYNNDQFRGRLDDVSFRLI